MRASKWWMAGAALFAAAGTALAQDSFALHDGDRVVFYGSLSSAVQELTYSIKATNIGTYTIPPAYGEAMYDRSLVARSIAGKIAVVKP